MAQRPRAILLASAIATTMRGFRARMRVSQPLFGVPNRPTACRTAMAPETKSLRMSRCPIFDVLPNRALPPVECCFGTSPSQAAKSRPRRKDDSSGANVSIASAVIGLRPAWFGAASPHRPLWPRTSSSGQVLQPEHSALQYAPETSDLGPGRPRAKLCHYLRSHPPDV